MKLIAKTEILYHSHMYEAGDELPQNDQAMVKAWLKAGTAEYEDQLKKAAEPILKMAEEILNKEQKEASQKDTAQKEGIMDSEEKPEKKAAVPSGRKKVK